MSDPSRENPEIQFESRRKIQLEIPGTLCAPGDLPVRVEIDAKARKIGKDARVLVCLHGSHSSSSEYVDVAEALGDSSESVVLVTSSRHENFDPDGEKPFMSEDGGDDFMTSGFAGKTYDMEVEDFQRAIDAVLDRAPELFGVSRDKVRLDILGTSLGATIAAQLSSRYNESTDRLVLASPSAKVPSDDPAARKPILDSVPDSVAFLGPLSVFKGKTVVIRGDRDEVTTEDEAQAFQSVAQSVRRVTIPGAGHTFGLFDFEQGEEEREQNRQAFLKIVREALV